MLSAVGRLRTGPHGDAIGHSPDPHGQAQRHTDANGNSDPDAHVDAYRHTHPDSDSNAVARREPDRF